MNDDHLFRLRLHMMFVVVGDMLCVYLVLALVQTITWAHELDSPRAIPGLFPQALLHFGPTLQFSEVVFGLVLIASLAHRTTRA